MRANLQGTTVTCWTLSRPSYRNARIKMTIMLTIYSGWAIFNGERVTGNADAMPNRWSF